MAFHLSRLVPFLGYHHVLMIFQVIVIVLTSILLAGCSSYSSMTNVFILGLSYANSTPSGLSDVATNLSSTLSNYKGQASLEVRTGYFGICVRQRGVLWLCSSDTTGLIEQIGPQNDPLNLIGTSSAFRTDVLFSGLLFMGIVLAFICFLLLGTFPGWHEERDPVTGSDVDIKPFPSRPVSQVALSNAFVAAVLLLTASLWQHVGAVGAATMVETANFGNVKAQIGAGAMAMIWISFTFEIIISIGLVTMILSIIVLDRLTDDQDS